MDDGKGPVQVVHGSTASDAPAAPFGAHVVPVLCRVLLALTGLAALVWLWADSVPGGHFLIRIALALGGLVLGFTWCWLAAYAAARRVWGPPVRGGVALMATAAVVLATAAMTVGHVPLRLRFELSRSAFEEVVRQGEAAVAAASPEELRDVFDGSGDRAVYFDADARVGWYSVEAALVDRDGTWMNVGDACCGLASFVHAPDGRPAWFDDDFRGSSSVDLGDGWYAYWSGIGFD